MLTRDWITRGVFVCFFMAMASNLFVKRSWCFCGRDTPKTEIVFFTQVILIYILVFCAIINICLQSGDLCFWTSLLTVSIAYLLPAPTLEKNKTLHSDEVDSNSKLSPKVVHYEEESENSQIFSQKTHQES